MSSSFRTEIRRYWIYCILDEIMETVFVGKSYAQNPKAHYYSHLRGEHSLTRDAYADADVTEPVFCILEVLYTTGQIAFKHVLAWYNYFEEHGYAILTDEKAGYMVDNMRVPLKTKHNRPNAKRYGKIEAKGGRKVCRLDFGMKACGWKSSANWEIHWKS